MQSIDLEQALGALCITLEIRNPPSIGWSEEKKGRFDGIYNPKNHRIEISRTLRTEAVNTIIVHELCHAVLIRAGYTSSGHSAVFLATYHLMLVKAGLGDTETIESAAVANWNKWTPWPYWYKHLVDAQEISAAFLGKDGFLESSTAQMIARAVMDARPYGKWTPLWVVYRWHEIIGDTRGNWFALWQLSRVLFFSSMGLLLTPFLILKQLGMILFGCSFVGLWLISKVFKLRSEM